MPTELTTGNVSRPAILICIGRPKKRRKDACQRDLKSTEMRSYEKGDTERRLLTMLRTTEDGSSIIHDGDSQAGHVVDSDS